MKVKNLLKNIIIIYFMIFLAACKDDKTNDPGPAPIADFTFTIDDSRAPAKVVFTNTSTNAGNFLWEFGGFNSSANIHPEFVYETPGDYVVKLTAYGPGGSHVVYKNLTIDNPPTKCKISSIHVITMPFTSSGGTPWDQFSPLSPIGPDVYYKIGESGGGGGIYLNGVADTINEVTYADLPVGWTLNIPFLITPLNITRVIYIYDYDTSTGSDFIGNMGINPYSSFDGYPATAILSNQSMTLEVGLIWE